MLLQQGNTHDCLHNIEATLLAIYGPMDDEDANLVE
jgi:hypothetical protein